MRNGTPFLFEMPLSKEENLLKCFEEIHDFIYSHDGLSPQQTLEEFVKVLFIKIYDEQSSGNSFVISQSERGRLQSGHSSKGFIDRIDVLFSSTKKSHREVFAEDDRIRLSQGALGFVVERLQEISLLDSAQDAKGLAFQKFLSRFEKGDRGQYFTPEPVVDFCVKMIQPRAGERIVDPACGSGGFLLSALKHLREKHPKLSAKDISKQQLHGIDISQIATRIAKMKLLLETGGKPNILCANSLAPLDDTLQQMGCQSGFDIVLTNPPFGAKISEEALLSQFDMGRKWIAQNDEFYPTKTSVNNQTAEILFIERSLSMLKPGGRMAIVLPNGNFDNPSLGYLRSYIKSQANVMAVVRLPQETFIPFGTGVKTSLLFLEKRLDSKKNPKSVFFAAISKLGYQGNKNGTPVFMKDEYGNLIQDRQGQPIPDEDFSKVCQAYENYLKGRSLDSSSSFSVGYSQLNGRFDYDFYSPEHRQFLSRLDESNSACLGEICNIVKEKSQKLKSQDALVEYIELSDINTHSFEIINSSTLKVHELPSRASYEIETGDILTAIAGNSVGTRKHATAVVSEEYSGSICTNGFRVFRNFEIDPFYFLFFLRSEIFLKQMYMLRTGAAIPNVSDKDLAKVRVYIPSKARTKEISDAVKRSFQLRIQAKQLFDRITLMD